jgi:hypothetical protein
LLKLSIFNTFRTDVSNSRKHFGSETLNSSIPCFLVRYIVNVLKMYMFTFITLKNILNQQVAIGVWFMICYNYTPQISYLNLQAQYRKLIRISNWHVLLSFSHPLNLISRNSSIQGIKLSSSDKYIYILKQQRVKRRQNLENISNTFFLFCSFFHIIVDNCLINSPTFDLWRSGLTHRPTGWAATNYFYKTTFSSARYR